MLRQGPNNSIVHRVVLAVAELDLQSGKKRPSTLVDAPAHGSVEELVELARERFTRKKVTGVTFMGVCVRGETLLPNIKIPFKKFT